MKTPAQQTDADIIIEGNRIKSVLAHAASNHTRGQVVDASNLTVMPGLINFHTHLQPDFGKAAGARLSVLWRHYGGESGRMYRTKRSRTRESSDAYLRTGPRVFSTGPCWSPSVDPTMWRLRFRAQTPGGGVNRSKTLMSTSKS